jgi:hypothetical protein
MALKKCKTIKAVSIRLTREIHTTNINASYESISHPMLK